MTPDDEPSAEDTAGPSGVEDESGGGPIRRVAGLAKHAVTGAAGYLADKRFERTPAGRARAAAEDGAATFHIRIDLDDIAYRARAKGGKAEEPEVTDVIGEIEAEGWRLDDIEYLTETDDWERTDEDGSVTRGSTQRTSAILLFRRS